MQKPNSYEEVKIGGDFTPIVLGGHHMIIKQVAETTSKAGNSMIVVLFDFAKNDSQPGYFTTSFENDIRPEKKWPYSGTKYILCEDNEGKCSKAFKAFITAFEESNGCEAVWGEKFAAQFKNKKIGGVFGEVESEYNGKTTMRKELRWFCDDSKADNANIPDAKYLNGNTPKTPSKTVNGSEGFMAIPEGSGDEIPW